MGMATLLEDSWVKVSYGIEDTCLQGGDADHVVG